MKKLNEKIIVAIYGFLIIFLLFYSYVLVDPNLTLINSWAWTSFRNFMVIIGYYQRSLSFSLYLLIIILLSSFHYYFSFKSKRVNPFKLAVLISGLLLFSYPLLSHDFFNYLFDAKIVSSYSQNPYLKTALDFPADPWIRFMHWTHRTYPYGPSWLILSLIPSFLALGKFVLNFLFFKLMFSLFYLSTVYCLNRINRTWALFFATSPLVIIEGLVNNHNDLIALSLGLIGVCFILFTNNETHRIFKVLKKNKGINWIFSTSLLFLSAGIKYMTIPAMLLSLSVIARNYMTKQSHKIAALPKVFRNDKIWPALSLIGIFMTIIYVSYKGEVQPWYFLNLLIFIPYYFNFVQNLSFLFFGLLLSYYPYIFLGGWDSPEKVLLKHQIIIVAMITNLIYIVAKYKKAVK